MGARDGGGSEGWRWGRGMEVEARDGGGARDGGELQTGWERNSMNGCDVRGSR